jgi:hypothetical protein
LLQSLADGVTDRSAGLAIDAFCDIGYSAIHNNEFRLRYVFQRINSQAATIVSA